MAPGPRGSTNAPGQPPAPDRKPVSAASKASSVLPVAPPASTARSWKRGSESSVTRKKVPSSQSGEIASFQSVAKKKVTPTSSRALVRSAAAGSAVVSASVTASAASARR